MNLIKILGLAMVAAIAAMAFGGAGTASAAVLCEVNETPCPPGSIIKEESALEFSLIGEEGEAQQQVTVTAGLNEVSCQASTLAGKITKNPGEPQVLAQIETATFGECTIGGKPCTVKPVQLPWEVHIEQAAINGNGIMWIGPKPGKLQSGVEMKECGALTGCVFKTHEKQPGYEAEWIQFAFTGGKQPTATATEAQLKSAFCGQGFLSAEYHVVKPKPSWVVQA